MIVNQPVAFYVGRIFDVNAFFNVNLRKMYPTSAKNLPSFNIDDESSVI